MGMEINSLWLTMMLIKIHFQRSRGVERAITTAALSTFFFFFFFPMGWKQSCSLTVTAKVEQKRRPGGWTPTPPHARVVPGYQWQGLGSPSPSVLPSLLRARLNPNRSTGESSYLVGGETFFLEGIFRSLFQQPLHAGAVLNYSLHQLANLLPHS